MKMMSVGKLVPHPRNSEFFDDLSGKCWDDFVSSIKTSGVIEPIAITEDNVIVSGHQRVRACKELGIEEIPAEIRQYNGDEKRIVKDLVETNVRQRGIISGSDAQIMARVKALDDWYGVQRGGDRSKQTNGTFAPNENSDMSQEDILKMLGLTVRQYKTAKKITECAIPEIQQLIENGTVSRRTVADLIAKLSPEDQKKLLDSLPEDVKFTAKSIEDKIAEIRAEGADNANAVQQKNNELEQRIDKLRRENNELRAGSLPAVADNQEELEEQKRKTREYYEKYQVSESGKEELRKMLKEYNDQIVELEGQRDSLKAAMSNKGDDAVVQLQCQIDELGKKLKASETRIKGLEAVVEEKDDEILELKQKGKDGALRNAITPELGTVEFTEREIQNLVSKVQITISNFMTAVNEIGMKADILSSVEPSILSALVEMSTQAVQSGETLNKVILAANSESEEPYDGVEDSEDEIWAESDMIATGSYDSKSA